MELNSLLQLQAAIKGCSKCRLRERGGKPVPGYGPPGARLFIVGEAPNRQSEAQNIPFLGWTGKVLSRWLEFLGVEKHEVYMTNAVKCPLRDNKGCVRTNGLGLLDEGVECRYWLAKEFALIRPKVMLLIGSVATRTVLGMSVYKVQEYDTGYEAKGRRHFALYHPARQGKLLDEDTRVILERLRPFLTV